jgi:hypothetical protein
MIRWGKNSGDNFKVAGHRPKNIILNNFINLFSDFPYKGATNV